MLLWSLPVFDEIISGTGTSWYTSTEFDAQLGSAEDLLVVVTTTLVAGTTPGFTITAEHSSDGMVFVPTFPDPILSSSMANGNSYRGSHAALPLGVVRLKISLTGTTPQCRMKVTATGHSS